MSGRLDGKTAVVTGGGTGIGEAIARLFAAEGCRVVVAGRRNEPIARVAGEISGLAVQADVTDEARVAALFKACDDSYGRLDVLVNNAALPGPTVDVADQDMEAWDQTFAVNVRGVILCMKHAVPLLKRRGGAVINMSSVAAIRAKPRRGAYAASKHAVLGITQAAAYELGVHGIRVNAVCPGGVDTAMLRRIIGNGAWGQGTSEADAMRRSADGNALRRLAAPRDIAEAALFLASDAAGAITGEYLTVDAGRM